MSELNDDMDELFRRAAENYPLKTGSSDWNKLNNALQAPDFTAPASIAQVKKKSYRRLLWLALLLLIPWICFRNKMQVDNQATNSAIKNKPANATLNNAGNEAPLTTNTENINKINKEEKIATTIALNNKKLAAENIFNAPQSSVAANQRGVDQQINADNGVSGISNEANLIRGEKDNFQVNTNHSEDTGQQQKNIGNITSPLVDTIKTTGLTDKNNKVEKKKKIAKLYMGVLTGGDISTVKFQSVKNVGLNLGVLVGYQVNKLIAIETGAIWDKKFYYSKGEYFNIKKIYLPSNSVIDNVNGNCYMIELPFNIKYNFKSLGRTTWFSLIGISSYFMKTENYDYKLDTGGVYYNRNRTYTNSASNWLSMMNVGLGYSHAFGKRKTSNLRIETYYKIPLKGVGIGSLHITSSGINIGFTKTIF